MCQIYYCNVYSVYDDDNNDSYDDDGFNDDDGNRDDHFEDYDSHRVFFRHLKLLLNTSLKYALTPWN